MGGKVKEHEHYKERTEQLEKLLKDQKVSLAEALKESDDKNTRIINLEEDVLITKDQCKSATDNMDECNHQISNFKLELEKRNSEIVGFINMLKKIKESLRTHGSPDFMINGDVFDIDTTDMSWDQ